MKERGFETLVKSLGRITINIYEVVLHKNIIPVIFYGGGVQDMEIMIRYLTNNNMQMSQAGIFYHKYQYNGQN